MHLGHYLLMMGWLLLVLCVAGHGAIAAVVNSKTCTAIATNHSHTHQLVRHGHNRSMLFS